MSVRFVAKCAVLVLLLISCDATPSRHRHRLSLDRMRRQVDQSQMSSRRVDELLVEQKLDHFDPSNNATWQQRYLRNEEFYQRGGPVIIYVGGDSPLSFTEMISSFLSELASENNALLLSLEHRYYGDSQPTSNLDVGNLRYLSSQQALEDLASFIRQLRAQNPDLASARWILYGCSYAGSLAAWARMRYPDLVDGAVASGAPLLARLNFSEYLEGVAQVLNNFAIRCAEDINTALQELEELLQSDAGVSTINQWFGLCEPLNVSNAYDVAGLYELVIQHFSPRAERNSLMVGSRSDVESDCLIFQGYDGDSTLHQLTRFLKLVNLDHCNDNTYEAVLEQHNKDGWDYVGRRQSLYQSCTEFGFFQTTDSDKQPFGHRKQLSYFLDMCSLLFGSEFTPERVQANIDATNQLYGGLRPNVTNVAFLNGELDPWAAVSVLEDLNDSSPAINIKYHSHCREIFGRSASHMPQMTAAQDRIRELVSQWAN